jgi:4-amino-4-deoxy-L-arabinose transferase-like glycosyltransferase
VAVVALTGLAFWVRFAGLDRRDGDLTTDEARLALAAQGVMATGLPILPSDRIYTRGLVTTYAMVPSLAAFGLHDWSARLPSVIAGALLVPASFLLGRAVAGPIPGLALAAFVALAGPLVEWSRQAWPPATFLLLFTLATYASYRGFARDEPRWQPLAALGFLLTLLAYELAMLLPLGLGLYLAGRMLRRDLGWWQGRWTLAALAIGALSLGLLAVLGLALRAGSLAGSDAEFRHYFTPSLNPTGLRYYVQTLWGPYLPLLVIAAAGAVWSLLSRRTLPPGLGFALSLLAAALIVPLFVIQGKQEQQYGLAVVPLLGLAGAAASSQVRSRRVPSSYFELACWSAGLLVCFAVVLRGDVVAALHPPTQSRAPTWIDDLRAQGWQPGDLTFAEAPLVNQLYLGRADFYIQPDGFERYARQDGDLIRSLYTNAVLLKQAGDFERFANGPYAGRTLWIVGHDDRLPRLTRQMDPALWQRLEAASGVTRPTRGWWIMRVRLPV